MADEPRLLVTLNNGIKRITFNAPERRNAVDRATAERFLEVVEETARDGSKVVILTGAGDAFCAGEDRSEEHTSELQSRSDLVCRLLLEKKKNINRPCVSE